MLYMYAMYRHVIEEDRASVECLPVELECPCMTGVSASSPPSPYMTPLPQSIPYYYQQQVFDQQYAREEHSYCIMFCTYPEAQRQDRSLHPAHLQIQKYIDRDGDDDGRAEFVAMEGNDDGASEHYNDEDENGHNIDVVVIVMVWR